MNMNIHIKYGLHGMGNVITDLKEQITKTNKHVLAFVGPIGAGKTTFIKKLVHSYGYDEADITSPTFNYVNIYRTKHKLIYHFDLYRLHTQEDFLEAGFQEYLDDPDALVIIEWPEIIMDLIKEKSLLVEIDYIDEQSREMIIKI